MRSFGRDLAPGSREPLELVRERPQHPRPVEAVFRRRPHQDRPGLLTCIGNGMIRNGALTVAPSLLMCTRNGPKVCHRVVR